MTDAEFLAARARFLAGDDLPAELLDDCRRTVELLIRTAGLPPHYSPLGVWSNEAVDEVFADWVAHRLVARGQLLAMLQRAPALWVFRRMAETSVRQHLIDGLQRSQSANLYERVGKLLANEQQLTGTGSGNGRLWRLPEGPAAPFDGDDKRLLTLAWALGDFNVIRYDASARKLSPLLEAEDLTRFVRGLLRAGAMTIGTIMRALQLRFAIEDQPQPVELDADIPQRGGPDPQATVVLADLVTATLAELTTRQARVLIGIASDVPGRELALQLGCSTGTVSHERSEIAKILARLGADAPDVLKDVLDALLRESV